MKTIILDTNFLMLPQEFNIDIFEEIKRIMNESYKLAVMDKTVDELTEIGKTGKTVQKLAAKVGLKLLTKYEIEQIPTDKKAHVDTLILNYISENTDTIVATQDAALKIKLKSRKIPLIVMRKKQYLELVQ